MSPSLSSVRASFTFLSTIACAASPALARQSDAGWQRLEAGVGPGLELVRNDGSEIELRGATQVRAHLGDRAAVENATRNVLVAAAELLGVVPDELALANHSDVAGLHVVQLTQHRGGAAVRGSWVELRWDAAGSLTSLVARGLARGEQREDFVVAREDAAELARFALPQVDSARLWARAPRRELVALDGQLQPVWSVDVWDPARPGSDWRVSIDAVDGSVREAQRSVLEALGGFVDGRGMASGPQTSGVPATLWMGNIQVTAVDRAIALQRVTSNVCGDAQVAISADAAKVAWISSCDGDGELWVASSDGSGALQLTSNATSEHSPVISSDGARIVFVSNAGGDDELWTILSNGTGLAQLTTNSSRDSAPALSGDGARVAYISNVDGDDELYTLLVGAPAPAQLTFDTTRDASPRIALDGSRIAWVSWRDGDAEICTITPAGGAFAQVTLNAVADGEPDITADGARVVFASRIELTAQSSGDPTALPTLPSIDETLRVLGARDVFESAYDGTGLQRLTQSDADEHAPSYATAGGCIAYVTDAYGDDDVELLDVIGGTLMRLTDASGHDRSPRVASTCGRGAWVANDGDTEIFTWDLGLAGASASGYANSDGAYALPFPDGASPSVETRLRGKFVRVDDRDPRWGNARATTAAVTPTAGANLLLNPTGFEEGPTAQVTAYYHADEAHDALATILTRAPLALPLPLAIDAPLKVLANVPEAVPNAFYSQLRREAAFFIGAGPARPNTAYDTLVLHEYGHYFDDMHGGYAVGSSCDAAGALGEGVGDTLAMFVTAQTTIGADFYGLGTSIRDYATFPWLGGNGVRGQQLGCPTCTPIAGKPEIHEHGAAFAGFAWDLRASLGAVTAENLIFGALTSNPADMQSAVFAVFTLGATPAFGGTGDPKTSPLTPAICLAAARHGFDCMTLPDQATFGCPPAPLFLCAAAARHESIGTEWLGTLFDGELACEPFPQPDNDAFAFPGAVMSGETKLFALSLSVDAAMKSSGRYGAPVGYPQLHERRVYVNAWMWVDNGMGGTTLYKVLGTGSSSPTIGPDNITPGNTLAFNPDTWAGTSLTYPVTIVMPVVPTARQAILRVRLDYGENAGAVPHCRATGTYAGPCGLARYGEVEDFQTWIMP